MVNFEKRKIVIEYCVCMCTSIIYLCIYLSIYASKCNAKEDLTESYMLGIQSFLLSVLKCPALLV